MKIAKVIPIHKEGKKASPSNYRPISILGKSSKIFEKVFQKRLIRYLEKFSLLTENQFGFRKKKDTVQAATLLWKTIQSNWATKTNSMGDFRKAFDTVHHESLLQKLHCLGIRGNVYALMASYLTESKQFVNVNSENSNLQLVKRGVPQGSILGPLLFLVYINDIGSNANIIGKLLLYADDTVLIENSPSKTGDLKYLQTWLARNKIDLNYTKSKFVIFEKRAKVYGNIELDEQTIAACVSYKYLGIYFDKKLNFDIHIGKVIEKLSKQCGIAYKLRETLNTSHLLAYIRAYVSPIVQYGVLLYGLGRKTMLQQILFLQKKLVRIAFRLPYRSSVLGKFKDCKICTVFELHIYELLKYSISQICNNFENLDIGSQQKDTRNREKNIWNYAANNDVLDFRAISLINILRKWGVFPSDHEVNEMEDEQLGNFQHRIADLYIFGNGELVDLIF